MRFNSAFGNHATKCLYYYVHTGISVFFTELKCKVFCCFILIAKYLIVNEVFKFGHYINNHFPFFFVFTTLQLLPGWDQIAKLNSKQCLGYNILNEIFNIQM